MAKRNPENDLVVSSNAAAAPVRRKSASKHAKHSAGAPTGAAEMPAPETAALAVAPVYVSEPSNEEIATLAYSYWEARGYQGGSPAEDWLRAEQELRLRVTA